MDKEEIFEMVVREMTEKALQEKRENDSTEECQLRDELTSLSTKVEVITDTLSAEDAQILDDYIVKTNLIADHDCAYLYVQGAKDCVELLKKLGVL